MCIRDRAATASLRSLQADRLAKKAGGDGHDSAATFLTESWDQRGLLKLREAINSVQLVSAEWLIALADAGGRVPRCQDVPPEARVSLEGLEASPGLPVLIVSYPWLSRAHPDELGEQLQLLRPIFMQYVAHTSELLPDASVGVFWDYLSLPQASQAAHEAGEDDRTLADLEVFKQGLGSINTWYAHPQTTVLLMAGPLPTGKAYLNTQPYLKRGWCQAEFRMSGMVKASRCLIDVSQLGDLNADPSGVADLTSLIGRGQGGRQPPMAPDAFRSMLVEGVRSGSIKFTNRGDEEVVANIYEKAFLTELSAARELDFGGLGWADAEVEQLAEAITFYVGKCGPLRNLRRVELRHNAFGSKGAVALKQVVGSGCMPRLEFLGLPRSKNAFSEEVIADLVAALDQRLSC